ncbi:hypothetical protein L1049_003502 [Liquidambar formosana]|uniref:Rapid ALkalinization Factor n=1 Tax=Liquidambar formosana TaxID=63359 RepID=A0AAP0N3B8_LIQFO
MVHKAPLALYILLLLSVQFLIPSRIAARPSQMEEKMRNQAGIEANKRPVHGSCSQHGQSYSYACPPPGSPS